MSENPYQSPQSESWQAIGVKSGTRADLRSVAKYQKGIMVCILVYFIGIVCQLALSAVAGEASGIVRLLIGLSLLGVIIAGTVFVMLLAIKVYDTALGVLLGILTLLPCIGLIVLLIVNQKATSILKQNGIRVGLMGADATQI